MGGVSILFYRREAGAAPPIGLRPGVTVKLWRPAQHGLPPPGPWRTQNLAWWAFTACSLFTDRRFFELTLWRDDHVAHRLFVTPRWPRFPFMAPGDLQVGEVWTDPERRGQGLARAGLAEAVRQADGARLWYLVEADNLPSIRLAEAAGFMPVGRGRRTRPFGLGVLGAYRLE